MPGNLERFSGFAHDYESVRPSPPDVLRPLLPALAKTVRPRLVVDIGSGTGLSSRYWADVADEVVGVEPNDDMRGQAVDATHASNVRFVKALSAATGLDAEVADIVTCSQALHWMEPEPTFAEVARILRPGGVFAAFDYDWPPATGVWEADQAYEECMRTLAELEARETRNDNVRRWSKDQHLARMRESGRFRYVREIVVHHVETGDADRFVGILLSQGGVRLLLRLGYSESELGIETFRSACRTFLGDETRAWHWSSRVRVAIR